MKSSTNNTYEYLTPSFETFMQACPLDGGLCERVNPGAALEDSRRELIGPHRQQTRELVRELLGPAASNEAVLFCETSIINQWLAVNFFKERRSFLLGRERLSKQAVEDLARHITLFLPGGLRAVREAIPAVRSNAIS